MKSAHRTLHPPFLSAGLALPFVTAVTITAEAGERTRNVTRTSSKAPTRMLQLHAILRRSRLTLAACVPLVLAACGGGGGGSDEPMDTHEDSDGAPQVTIVSPADNSRYELPSAIDVRANASDADGSVVEVEFFANGQSIGRDTDAPYSAQWVSPAVGSHVLTAVARDDDGNATTSAGVDVVIEGGEFVVSDVRMGDPNLCYVNPEFSDDGEYLVWGERIHRLNAEGEGIVRMWHCAIDQETGEFIPWDCKGFAGFDSTNWGRAYMGRDSQGLFYLGANENYQLTMTRITGPDSGVTTVLRSLADRERRAIYPSVLPDSDKIYAYWLKSHGPNITPQSAEWVELRYVDIDDPTNEVIVERQYNTRGLVPMDVTFPRWAFHEPLLHYGREDELGRINVWQLDVSQPGSEPVQLTNDSHIKTGPYPVEFEGRRYILSGVDGETESYVYREPEGGGLYEVIETFAPAPQDTFPNACLANSHEPVIHNGRLFTSWQITDCQDTNDVFAFLSEPGEIWFTQLLDGSDELWRLNQPSTDVKNEPEPVVGTSEAWVFYTAYPDGYDQGTACYELRRAATPASLLD
jgi:hypothetical protein